MNNIKDIVLSLPENDKQRAKQLAREIGCSENSLYAELIHEGLTVREQRNYIEKLRALGQQLSRDEVLDILDRAPDVEPEEFDKIHG